MYESATGAPANVTRSFAGFDSKPGATRIDQRLGAKLWNTATATTQSVNNLLFFNVRDDPHTCFDALCSS